MSWIDMPDALAGVGVNTRRASVGLEAVDIDSTDGAYRLLQELTARHGDSVEVRNAGSRFYAVLWRPGGAELRQQEVVVWGHTRELATAGLWQLAFDENLLSIVRNTSR